MKRYQIGDIDNEQFYQLTKGLFMNPIYKHVSPAAKVVYAILKDRMEISRKNGWHDDNGDIYLLFNQDKLGEFLGVTTRQVRTYLQELKDSDLIESIRQGLGKPNKMYIKKCKKCTSRAEENFLTDGKNTSYPERKNTSAQTGRKLPVKSGRILPPSKTEYSKTEYSKTNKSNNTPYSPPEGEGEHYSQEFALVLNAFEEHRKKLKKPMTDYAKKLLVNKLSKMASTEQEQIAILNQSIENGWQGIFPLGGEKKNQSYNRPTAADMAEQAKQLLREKRGTDNDGARTGHDNGNANSCPAWFSCK